MKNPNFEVASNLLKIRQHAAYALFEHFVHVNTLIGLEQIEVGKFRTATTSLTNLDWVTVGVDL